MKKSVGQLKEVMKQEIIIYTEMLKIAKEKTDVIIGGHIKKLEKITDQEQNIIMKIGKFEDIRENVVFNIQKELDLGDELDMSKIKAYLDDEDKEFIEDQKQKLLNILNELKEINTLNGTLINDSLEYINLNIDILTNNSFDTNYGDKSKEVNVKPSRRMFDTKA